MIRGVAESNIILHQIHHPDQTQTNSLIQQGPSSIPVSSSDEDISMVHSSTLAQSHVEETNDKSIKDDDTDVTDKVDLKTDDLNPGDHKVDDLKSEDRKFEEHKAIDIKIDGSKSDDLKDSDHSISISDDNLANEETPDETTCVKTNLHSIEKDIQEDQPNDKADISLVYEDHGHKNNEEEEAIEDDDDDDVRLGFEDLNLDSNDETSYVASSLSPDVKSPVSDVSSSSGIIFVE